MNKLFILSVVLFFALLTLGCQQTIPKEALALSPTSLEDRQIQTRLYDTNDEEMILSACAGILQDLGFSIDESETKLGFLFGTKDRDATDATQVAAAVVLALLGGASMAIDKNQKFKIAIVVSPNSSGNKIRVRATFQRIVWNTNNQVTKAETMSDPEIYQEFFSKLSKSVFLEGQKI